MFLAKTVHRYNKNYLVFQLLRLSFIGIVNGAIDIERKGNLINGFAKSGCGFSKENWIFWYCACRE